MLNLIFHTLKGINIWHKKIDVYKVIKMNYRKRLFCIFDTYGF